MRGCAGPSRVGFGGQDRLAFGSGMRLGDITRPASHTGALADVAAVFPTAAYFREYYQVSGVSRSDGFRGEAEAPTDHVANAVMELAVVVVVVVAHVPAQQRECLVDAETELLGADSLGLLIRIRLPRAISS